MQKSQRKTTGRLVAWMLEGSSGGDVGLQEASGHRCDKLVLSISRTNCSSTRFSTLFSHSLVAGHPAGLSGSAGMGVDMAS